MEKARRTPHVEEEVGRAHPTPDAAIAKEGTALLAKIQHIISLTGALISLFVLGVLVLNYRTQTELGNRQLSISDRLARLEELASMPLVGVSLDTVEFHLGRNSTSVYYSYEVRNAGQTPAVDLSAFTNFTNERDLHPAVLFGQPVPGPRYSLFPGATIRFRKEIARPDLAWVGGPMRDTTLYFHIGLSFADPLGDQHLSQFAHYVMLPSITEQSATFLIRLGVEYWHHAPVPRRYRPSLADSSFLDSVFAAEASSP